MIRHVTTNIDFVLGLEDDRLEAIFQAPAKEIREELLANKAKGHVKIPSEGCEGFDPVTGCPGQ